MAKAYERIADDLRRRIRAGELRPGDRLPAETAMVEEYGKSLPTLRQALGLLASEGLIEKQHGRGNFVRIPRTPVRRTNLRHQWEKDRARGPEEQRAQTGATEHDNGLVVDDLVLVGMLAQAAGRARGDRTLAAKGHVAETVGKARRAKEAVKDGGRRR
jgi:GntR family transcriptional regulator